MVKILIVDDAGHIRLLLAKLLGMYELDVIQAEDGVEAIAKYKEFNPDMVFTDISMPNMDGIALVHAIIAHDAHAKICMVTSISVGKYIADAINAGAKNYIVKPFDKKKIIDTIEQMLSIKLVVKVRESHPGEAALPDERKMIYKISHIKK